MKEHPDIVKFCHFLRDNAQHSPLLNDNRRIQQHTVQCNGHAQYRNDIHLARIVQNLYPVSYTHLHCDDADYLIVAFGSMARIGQKAMELAREEGIKVGMLRPITLWPFPTKAIAAYADKVKGMLVTELNAGQMVEDVRLAVNGKVKVEHFGRLGGIVPDPDEIVDALKEKLIKK